MYEKPPQPGPEGTVLQEIEHGKFHSELDRQIAAGVVGEILAVADRRQQGPEAYESALDSVRALVPQTGDGGFRYIAGARLTKQHEERVASRVKSTEIDMNDSENGTWGSLPEPVKRHIVRYSGGLNIEPASHCTVGCSFCTIARHGRVESKASLGSILDTIEFFCGHRADDLTPVLDTLYYGSDPFDLKWQELAYERDYTDLARAYHQITDSERELFTSTAVPLGEEWRVLRYLIDKFDNDDKERFRFSITKGNQDRVDHIINITEFLDKDKTKQLLAHNHAGKPQFISQRGQSFLNQNQVGLKDIYGPESADRVIIGVTAVRGVVLRGATMSHPYGDVKTPLGSPVNGGHRYSIPRFYRAPLSARDLDGPFYPPAIIDHLIVSSDGSVIEHTEVQKNDPYRALVRVAKGFDLLYEANNYQPTMEMQRRFAELFVDSLEVMQAHLAKHPDKVMSAVMRLIRDTFSGVEDQDAPDLDK